MTALASYASNPMESKGRFFDEKIAKEHAFLKDRERIIHSVAFRRLEYKTQVFVNHLGDHYRNRLTHSLEVSQIARMVCRYLNLNEDLSEAIALCHDLGHPPFGHAGEDGLNEASKDYCGFEHNLNTIKIITKLENRHIEFDGLNLTWETLEGIIKHNGPFSNHKKYKEVPELIKELDAKMKFNLNSYASLEAQVANLCDDIAYTAHDFDDGLRADMFEIEEIESLDFFWCIYRSVYDSNKSVYPNLIKSEMVRRILRTYVDDLVATTKLNLEKLKPNSPEDIRNAGVEIAHFSSKMEEERLKLKKFLTEKVYRNFRVNRMTLKAESLVKDLFERLMDRPNCLPTEWYQKTIGMNKNKVAEIICDYIAGMTDRYAIDEHKKLFDPSSF